MNNSPWKEMYDRMSMECAENEAEQHVLEMLRSGKDISDCLEYYRQTGADEESFFKLMDRADKRETDELRRNRN